MTGGRASPLQFFERHPVNPHPSTPDTLRTLAIVEDVLRRALVPAAELDDTEHAATEALASRKGITFDAAYLLRRARAKATIADVAEERALYALVAEARRSDR